MSSKLRIVFMGTPDFAVPALDILVKNSYNIVGVITMPDKPAGRGYQLQPSPIKKYALTHNLNLLQPEKLKEESFLEELYALKADLQIVVAFRMLPEVVWNMPKLGTFNLHSSLLPHYRGAAPINRAIMNGEKISGVSTFFLQHAIDTGKIIFQESVDIAEDETAGELHDTLMILGSKLVLKTVKAIEEQNFTEIEQEKFIKDGTVLNEAPKIFKEDCRINWNYAAEQIFNLIRGLSPYPAAFTELMDLKGNKTLLKLFKASKIIETHHLNIGDIECDQKSYLKVAVKDGFVLLHEVQLAGKSRMNIENFLRGNKIEKGFKMI